MANDAQIYALARTVSNLNESMMALWSEFAAVAQAVTKQARYEDLLQHMISAGEENRELLNRIRDL